jgi:acyl dehydratase
MTARFDSIAAVLAAVGQDLGSTDWVTVDQARIDTFAEATGDHQWLHVDPVRAKDGPFGVCVAHGYLTLALANLFLPQLVGYDKLKMGVNVGCDRVRFPAPVKVDSRVRGRGTVVSAEPMQLAGAQGVQVVVRVGVEIEGADKPGCVVDTISRLSFHS